MRTAILIVMALCSLTGGEVPVLPESQPYVRAVRVDNPYERAVRVVSIDVTCQCQELRLDQSVLLPGGSATLHMHVDNRNLSGLVRRTVWLYVSDPAYEPIELTTTWQIRPHIAIDLLPPAATSTARPAEQAWRDIYQYTADVRPEDLVRQRKVIRIGAPAGEVPPGGLRLELDYDGQLWTFETRRIDPGSLLLIARGADIAAPTPGIHEETLTLRSNHPHKERIELRFHTSIRADAGQGSDPFGALR